MKERWRKKEEKRIRRKKEKFRQEKYSKYLSDKEKEIDELKHKLSVLDNNYANKLSLELAKSNEIINKLNKILKFVSYFLIKVEIKHNL